MISAVLPYDEPARLQRLRETQLLDTPADPIFDSLAARALKSVEGASIASLSLIDKDRQWFKSVLGLSAAQTTRAVSFCAHAILTERPLVVPDATLDRRFASNPLVRGEPHIRFYLGVPLAGGIGALCVIGSEPRRPSTAEVERMILLARLADTQITMFRALRDLASAPGPISLASLAPPRPGQWAKMSGVS